MYIYRTIVTPLQKKYIGACTRKQAESTYYYGSSKQLKADIKNMDKSLVVKEILVETDDINTLARLEQETINKYGAVEDPSYYNQHNVSSYTMYGKKGKDNPLFGKPLTAEHKAKMSEAKKGKKLSAEAKEKISQAQKGRKHTDEHRKKVSEAGKRRKHSAETKAKLSKATKAYWAKRKELS